MRHRTAAHAIALAVGLAVAGCGGDGGAEGATAPGTGVPGPTTPATSGPEGDPAAADPTAEAPAGGPEPAPEAAPPAPAPAGDDGSVPSVASDGPPGSYAPQILQPDAAREVVLALHPAGGAEPAAGTVEHLRSTLAAVAGKPVDVVAAADPGGATVWTSASIRAVADGGPAADPSTAVVHLLFLHGTFEGDTSVLGIAVRGDVAAVFVDQAAAASGLLGDPEAITTSVATHELGHLLGLVDLVLHTGRADPEHPGHSANRGSVMYWAVESDVITSLLGARPPRDFDAEDLADLQAIAGG